MTAKHAGSPLIADQALLDQVNAAVADMQRHLISAPLSDDPAWVNRWAGRALYLLDEIARLSE